MQTAGTEDLQASAEEAELSKILDTEIAELEAAGGEMNPRQLREWVLAMQAESIRQEQEQQASEGKDAIPVMDWNIPRSVNFAGD